MGLDQTVSLAVSHPLAAFALAMQERVQLAVVLTAAAIVVVLVLIAFIRFEIRKMRDAGNAWAASEKRAATAHRTFLRRDARRHKEAMEALAAGRAADERRHEQAMRDLRRLVRKTAPRGW